ncbi:MAG: asparagine synthase (glutamine-hydrolyzing), partial [Candidatus Pacearchaeota archaeon]
LSRDRFGKKPLYYYFDKGKFIFSSEIKGILEHKLNLEINKGAVDLYLSLGFIPSPYSIYKNLFKVEARQSIFYNLVDRKMRKEYYYTLPKYAPSHDKKALLKEGLELMRGSVKQRLISDVPLGVFLSGGLDSSAITYLMKDFINLENLNTFSIGFEGKFDESKYAKIVSKTFGTKHHHKFFKKEDFDEILRDIFYYYDEPFSDISMFPTYFLSGFAKEDVSVCLSGDGGDEIFGGYPRYIRASQIESLRKIPFIFRRILFVFSKILLLKKIKEGIRLSFLPPEEIFSEAREEIYKPQIYKKLIKEKFSYCLKNSRGNLVEAFRLMDIYFYTLPDNYLNKVDRASMANSLEVRSPFLDYRLMEYSFKIPTKWKVSKGKTKILMKEILKDKLPREIVERKKKGFTPPLADWLNEKRNKKETKKYLEELYSRKIIDLNWKKFYDGIIDKNDMVSMNYKIRFIMLYHWLKFWEKRINL